MSQRRVIQFVDAHTAGEPTRTIFGGFPRAFGVTMEERRQRLSAHTDRLRRFVLNEPRGHHNMFGASLSEPIDPTCAVGVFFMESGGYLRMSGLAELNELVCILEILGADIDPEILHLDDLFPFFGISSAWPASMIRGAPCSLMTANELPC